MYQIKSSETEQRNVVLLALTFMIINDSLCKVLVQVKS